MVAGAPLRSAENLVWQNGESFAVLTSEHKDALRKARTRTRDQTSGDVCLKQQLQEQIDNPGAAFPTPLADDLVTLEQLPQSGDAASVTGLEGHLGSLSSDQLATMSGVP